MVNRSKSIRRRTSNDVKSDKATCWDARAIWRDLAAKKGQNYTKGVVRDAVYTILDHVAVLDKDEVNRVVERVDDLYPDLYVGIIAKIPCGMMWYDITSDAGAGAAVNRSNCADAREIWYHLLQGQVQDISDDMMQTAIFAVVDHATYTTTALRHIMSNIKETHPHVYKSVAAAVPTSVARGWILGSTTTRPEGLKCGRAWYDVKQVDACLDARAVWSDLATATDKNSYRLKSKYNTNTVYQSVRLVTTLYKDVSRRDLHKVQHVLSEHFPKAMRRLETHLKCGDIWYDINGVSGIDVCMDARVLFDTVLKGDFKNPYADKNIDEDLMTEVLLLVLKFDPVRKSKSVLDVLKPRLAKRYPNTHFLLDTFQSHT